MLHVKNRGAGLDKKAGVFRVLEEERNLSDRMILKGCKQWK